MNILFWLYRSKQNRLGHSPIYVRFTIGGEREQLSTGISISTQKWRKDKQLVAGNSVESQAFNEQLRQIKADLYAAYNELAAFDRNVSAYEVRLTYTGEQKRLHSILETYREHNIELRKLVGINHKITTVKHFESSYNTLAAYIKGKIGEDDFLLKKLTTKFIRDFSIYLLA